MVRGSRRTGFTGSALIRLLARLAELDVAESRQAFAERLSQWLGWTDAIALSAALDGSPAGAPDGRSAAPPSASAEEREFTRVRTSLASAVAADGDFTADPRRPNLPPSARGASMDTKADFLPYRQHYLARQQAMEAGIGPLRRRLRTTLAGTSPAMARLAAMDAVMEQALGAHERRLLASVPALLEKRFEGLRKAHRDTLADAHEPGEPDRGAQPGGWLDVFRDDLHAVLLAELDIRMQPVEGLLEALRTRQPGRHE